MFDDYLSQKCANCEHWWTNRCDGLPESLESRCTAFKPIRSIDIPEKIKSLRSELKALRTVVTLLSVWSLVTMVLFGTLII